MVNKTQIITIVLLSVIAISLLIIAFKPATSTGQVIYEEPTSQIEQTQYANFKVKLYIDDTFDNFNNYLSNPDNIPSHFNKFDNIFLSGNFSYGDIDSYEPHYLYLSLDKEYNEDINCELSEYYDNSLNDKFNIEFLEGIRVQERMVYYEKQDTPSRVRYELNCGGFESDIEFKDVYNFDLIVQ